ncbi:MAG: T9SS type A sorting domain-containing protein, partial [Bacteroidales bacterium]|nr:T9SS type A sorting domain-containing protein [Bacteroidales bacterium]
ENNIFHYPYCWIGKEDPKTCLAVRCTISNEGSCGSDACDDPEKVKWINNDFKYQWEMSEYWTEPEVVFPKAPGDLSAVPLSDRQVELSWVDNSDNEDGFVIERTFGSSSFIQIGKVDSNITTFTDKFMLSARMTYSYRVKSFLQSLSSEWSNTITITTPEADGTLVQVNYERQTVLPTEFLLEQNFPNPFNPSTTISYQLPKDCMVQVKVFNLNGQFVEMLVDAFQPGGWYQVIWKPENIPSGNYLVQLKAGDFQMTTKVIYQK